jgi:transposase
LGVDDFSFRRRISFGTILIDLEKRLPVDRLPDREAETFAKWLMAHPGVEILRRDRGGDDARGASIGAPNAVQTADRWHLLKNLCETKPSFFLRKQAQLTAATQEAPSVPSEEPVADRPWETGRSKQQEEKSVQSHQERVKRETLVPDLFTTKGDVASMARQVGMSRQGVYNELQMKPPPERTRLHRPGGSRLEPSTASLIRRGKEGCRNAQLLERAMKAQGSRGSDTALGRWIAPWRALKGKARRFTSVEPKPETMIHPEEGKKKRPPPALQVAPGIPFKEEQRLAWPKDSLARLGEADPPLHETSELIQEGTTRRRERQGERRDEWRARVEKQGVAELQGDAQGLQKDYEAVKAGLPLEWSNGQTEGQVHRLKLLKRQRSGRGRFDLLRKRVLKRA